MFRKGLQLTIICLLLTLLIIGATSDPALAKGHHPPGDDRPVTVMTRNVYIGADLNPILQAIATGDLELIAQAVFQVYQASLDSNIPDRAAAIAAEIAGAQPELVGLQEAHTWTGPLGSVDFLQLLLDALAAEGASYEAIAVVQGFSFAFPYPDGSMIALGVSDVILARTDLPASRLKLSNVQQGYYDAKIIYPLPDGTAAIIPRQWASVDVKIRGKSFRFITTHLESIDPPLIPVNVRYLQAQELLAGPAATDLPVVLVGDFNSEKDEAGDAAQLLIDAGFVDSWQAVYPGRPGDTCCHPADLSDRSSQLEQQIDLVLWRGDFDTVAADIVGDKPVDFDLLNQWPSDHAGVLATLLVPKHRER